MLDTAALQPKSDGLDDLNAAIAAITDHDAAATQRLADLNAERKDLLASGSLDQIKACEDQLREARLDIDRLDALQDALRAKLPAARQAQEILALRARVAAADAKLAELDEALEAYPAAAEAIAKVARLSQEHALAVHSLGRALVLAREKYPEAGIVAPVPALAQYHDLIRLPGVAAAGDDGVARAYKQYWPAPRLPDSAPPAPPKEYGPARFTSTSYEVRRPGMPLPPPAVEWRTVPDHGAA